MKTVETRVAAGTYYSIRDLMIKMAGERISTRSPAGVRSVVGRWVSAEKVPVPEVRIGSRLFYDEVAFAQACRACRQLLRD